MNSLRYQNKVVIITGGSRGIGEGCTRVFFSNGAKVVLCAKETVFGPKLEKELNSSGGPGEAYFVQCDVGSEDDIKNLVQKTVEKYGQIDCVINNAGAHPNHMPIDDFSLEDCRNLMNINFMGCFALSKYALPYLRKTKGNIINMSSLVAVFGQPGAVTYAATKGAITSFTKALAIDESANGVRVNSVSPGNIWTPLWSENASACENPVAAVTSGAEAQLLGRMGTLEEAGKLCLFIAAEATFQTGVDFLLTGGAELSYGKKARAPVIMPTETYGFPQSLGLS